MPVPLSTLSPAPAESTGQLWFVSELGGNMYHAPMMSKKLRLGVQPRARFRQFCELPESSQPVKHKGETFSWSVHGKVETRGRRITELEDIPRTRAPLSLRSVTVTEWGNSIPTTRKLLELAAEPVEEIVKKQLEEDCAMVLDGGAYEQYVATPIKVGPAGGDSPDEITVATNGTAPVINNSALTLNHALGIELDMREGDVPTYAHGDYYAIGRPTAFKGIRKQLDGINQYTESGISMIRSGEIGKYHGVRFVEQTAQARSEDFAGNNYLSDEVFFFGDDATVEACVTPEEVQTAIPSGFGRNRAIAWFYMGEFALTYDQAAEARIWHWTSATA